MSPDQVVGRGVRPVVGREVQVSACHFGAICQGTDKAWFRVQHGVEYTFGEMRLSMEESGVSVRVVVRLRLLDFLDSSRKTPRHSFG
jgi:hypothetical protein